MEHIEDLFLISNFRTKIYGTFLQINQYFSEYWFLIDTVTLKWLVSCETLYFAMKPAELVLIFCLQLWIQISEDLSCLFISLLLIL